MAFEEVLRQRAHERAVIDGSADGIAVLDGAGLVRQWNPAAHRLTGLPADAAMGKAPPFPQPEPGGQADPPAAQRAAGSTCCAPRCPAATSASSTSVT